MSEALSKSCGNLQAQAEPAPPAYQASASSWTVYVTGLHSLRCLFRCCCHFGHQLRNNMICWPQLLLALFKQDFSLFSAFIFSALIALVKLCLFYLLYLLTSFRSSQLFLHCIAPICSTTWFFSCVVYNYSQPTNTRHGLQTC